MLFDLSRLRAGSERVERTIPAAAFNPQDPEYRVAAPVELVADVRKLDHQAFGVTGRVTTALELSCGRCLEPFTVPVDASFDLRYVPSADNTGEDDREVGEDDLTTAYYREGMLDVEELLREQFVLALPMKPLCREDCRGLCVSCGTNLNRETCDCTPAWEDPRLTALKSLLPRDKEN